MSCESMLQYLLLLHFRLLACLMVYRPWLPLPNATKGCSSSTQYLCGCQWELPLFSRPLANNCSPYSTVNLLALLNILFHIHGRSLRMSTLQIINICLPTAFSVCYALAGILTYRECGHHRAEEGTTLLTDEEMQRRQLLRLLGERNTSAPSPDLVRNTYRFDLPEDERAQKDWSHLTPWRRLQRKVMKRECMNNLM